MLFRVFGLCLILACPALAEGPTFAQTAPLIQKALLNKEMNVLYKQIDLTGIVRSKIRRVADQAADQKSNKARLFGKALKLGGAPLTKLVTEIVLKEYRSSPYSLRQSYLNRLKIDQVGEKGDSGYAIGTFMGSPAYISAVKAKGTWVVVGVGSAVIDRELDNLLRLLVK